MGPARVLIVDDHALMRQGLRALLASVPGVACTVGEASGGEEAVAMAADLAPDVILMDLHMPGTNGIDATRRILATAPNARILVLTMLDDDDSVFAAMRAGARGYLIKGSDAQEVVRAVAAVALDGAIFSPAIARRMMHYFAAIPPAPSPATFPELTEREREILGLIAVGKSNAAIAATLGVSGKTVSNHVSNIFNKLQVVDWAQAALRARAAGLARPTGSDV